MYSRSGRKDRGLGCGERSAERSMQPRICRAHSDLCFKRNTLDATWPLVEVRGAG